MWRSRVFSTLTSQLTLQIGKVLSGKAPDSGYLSRSPVPHLLCSNEAPGDAERMVILEFVDALMASSVANLQDVSRNEGPEAQRNSFIIQSHLNILSVVRKLPFDILRTIMLIVVESERKQINLRPVMPWRLSLVCRRWREISLTSPLLWSHVAIRPLKESTTKKLGHTKAIKALTKHVQVNTDRSGTVPLHVTLCSETGPNQVKLTHSLLAPLLNQSHRWQTLDISSSTIVILHVIQDIKDRIPLLRSLQLQLLDHKVDGHELGCDTFENAPLLSLVDVNISTYVPLRLPWAQIQRCIIRSGQEAYLDNMLANPACLQAMTFVQIVNFSRIPTRIIVPTLLHLEVFVSKSTVGIFEKMSSPNLQSLVINAEDPTVVHYLTTVLCGVAASIPLQSLTLRLRSWELQGSITALVALLPDLKSLDVPFPIGNDLTACPKLNAEASYSQISRKSSSV